MKYRNRLISQKVLTDPLTQLLSGFQYQIYSCRYNTQNRIRNLFNVLLPYIKLAVILDGECEITIQGQRFHGKTGDCFLVPPYLLHSARYLSEELHTFEVVFQVNGLNHQEDFLSLFHHQLAFRNFIEPSKKQHCIDLYADVKNNKAGAVLRLQHWISEAALQLLQNTPLSSEITRADSALVQTTNEFLHLLKQGHYDYTVSDYCDLLHVSQSYLCRCTLEVMQLSPRALIIQHRMFNSLMYLADPDLSIEQISELLQYQTPSYFCSQFKKTFQLTPKQYRSFLI